MSSKKPEIVVFAGPNGSGKSTFTTSEWIKGKYINADDIERERHITTKEAADLADLFRSQCIEGRETFTFETVLSTSRKLDLLQEAKQKGYFIRGYFVLTCDPLLNVARVHSRVCNGGHHVEKETILRRYVNSLKNIPAFLDICDICHIYDNTIEPFRLCRKHINSITLYASELWPMQEVQKLVFGTSNQSL